MEYVEHADPRPEPISITRCRELLGEDAESMTDLHLLNDRAGPSVGHDQRQRLFMLRANVSPPPRHSGWPASAKRRTIIAGYRGASACPGCRGLASRISPRDPGNRESGSTPSPSMRLPDGLLMDDDGRRGGRSDSTLRAGGWRRCVDQAIGTLGLARVHPRRSDLDSRQAAGGAACSGCPDIATEPSGEGADRRSEFMANATV